jgi:hypothetical protein
MNAAGGVETNRKGNVCIQVETLFFPYCRVGGKVYATLADTPCLGLDRLMAWLRSWGVPDVWPMGVPTWSANRNATTWNTRSGHYGHSQVPENDHTDPGPMPNLFGVAAAPQEDDMPTADEIAQAVWNFPVPIPRRNPDGTVRYEPNKQGASWPLVWGNIWAAESQARDAALQGAIAGLSGLLAQHHDGLTAEQVEAAVKAAIADSLVHVQVDVAAAPHTA